ncbi:MAG TPA: dihydroorotate dehydrogenase (quinone), partial [Kribbellaceae bacterium]
MYGRVVRPVLFRLGKGDAEVAHEQTLRGLRLLNRVPGAAAALSRAFGAGLERTVFGVRFPGPVGLAAGMDKNGVALPAWRALGFGFVEVGTVTAHAQPGNPQPRLFRLVEHEAVINRMGFNNLGSSALAARLEGYG